MKRPVQPYHRVTIIDLRTESNVVRHHKTYPLTYAERQRFLHAVADREARSTLQRPMTRRTDGPIRGAMSAVGFSLALAVALLLGFIMGGAL